MKPCDACGKPKAAMIGIGGATLCRTCAVDVETEITTLREQGKRVNALGIARRRFREVHGAADYLLRDIPRELMEQIRDESHNQRIDMRAWMLDAFRGQLAKKP